MQPVIGESFKGDQSQNLALWKKIKIEGIDLAIQQSFYGHQSRRLLLESDLSINTVCTNFRNESNELLYLDAPSFFLNLAVPYICGFD